MAERPGWAWAEEGDARLALQSCNLRGGGSAQIQQSGPSAKVLKGTGTTRGVQGWSERTEDGGTAPAPPQCLRTPRHPCHPPHLKQLQASKGPSRLNPSEDSLLTHFGKLNNFLEEVEFKGRLTQEASAKGILGAKQSQEKIEVHQLLLICVT